MRYLKCLLCLACPSTPQHNAFSESGGRVWEIVEQHTPARPPRVSSEKRAATARPVFPCSVVAPTPTAAAPPSRIGLQRAADRREYTVVLDTSQQESRI